MHNGLNMREQTPLRFGHQALPQLSCRRMLNIKETPRNTLKLRIMASQRDSASPTTDAPTAPTQPLHSVAHWEQLAEEPEEGGVDADSALGSNPPESTESLTSSILQYRTINGRTFHSERGNARYWASNDEKQNESMDIVHHFLSLVFDGKLYLAPLEKDIQGRIFSDFADEFPNTEVVGTDISPIQPSWIPPNLKFEIDDCSQEWTFEPNSVDFVHMRFLYGSIKDWSFLINQAYKTSSAMMQSDDGTVTEDSAMHEWGKFFIEGGKKMGQTFTILEDDVQRKCMEEAGFINIHIDNRKASPHHQLLGWTMDEVRVYCAQLRRELRNNKKYHPFYWVRKVYGQKPEV
ncbi:uncharacterized protein NECHADRAFT_87533 [Fusarium vanettenii 77-13-4]|uniref:Methyltransferase type 11 domain-containing protein n=1 Tax=Fusarium vanettenii (strain ATCC MYA-4622 / CBS 123669 / FGSC 9596 / NRRL 45880 / 77-13-4) TaxID=660122 RepID=C7ZEL3_FUSV7|nr:uncharacterized protein NECHADRAFT_87533 [Fusarium vanettenii 77-13-4]EEU37717.1 hypothetical protein NECHADRAFT_87533 [Fusarium vanettenii 77-13-4]